MADIVLRSVKGSPLTIAEADANINNLNSELGSKLNITSYTPVDVLAKLLTVDGLNSGLDADRIQNKNIALIFSAIPAENSIYDKIFDDLFDSIPLIFETSYIPKNTLLTINA